MRLFVLSFLWLVAQLVVGKTAIGNNLLPAAAVNTLIKQTNLALNNVEQFIKRTFDNGLAPEFALADGTKFKMTGMYEAPWGDGFKKEYIKEIKFMKDDAGDLIGDGKNYVAEVKVAEPGKPETEILTIVEGSVNGAGNRFFSSIDDFKDAIARGENVFYVGKHTDITPRPTGVQSHHGVNTVWMDAKYSNYSMNNAPSVYMLNNPNHNATRGVFNTWRSEIATQQGVSIANVNYSLVSKDEILKLAERQFDAADVPRIVRDEYYKLWDDYLNTLTPR
jgi:hypothetical protein